MTTNTAANNEDILKTYFVKVTSTSFHSEIYSVQAYSKNHAEEVAWEMCGGPAGFAVGMTFACVGKAKKR